MKKTLLFTGLILLLSLSATAQYSTKALIEVFTGASCKYCPAANAHVDSLVAANPLKVMAIKYQSMPPGYDPLYLDDSADVNQLARYYTPSSFPDGLLNGKTIYPTDITQAMIDSVYFISSAFTLTLSHYFNQAWDTIYVKLLIRANTRLSFASGVLHARIAVSEDSIWFFAPPGSNEEKTFYKVLKKMLPDAVGTTLRSNWAQGQLDSVVIAYPMMTTMYNFNNISVSAFIQQDDTKGVLQSALSTPRQLPYYALVDRLLSLQLAPVQCFDSLLYAKLYFFNAGSQALTSCRLSYAIDTGPYNYYTWSGYLDPGATTYVALPTTFMGNGMHTVKVKTDIPGNMYIFPSRMAAYSNSLSVQKNSVLPPLHEYFKTQGFPYAGWAVYNQSKNGNTWRWVSLPMDTTKYLLGALQLRWFIMNEGSVNELFLPAVDVTSKSSLALSWDMVYASFGDLSHDTLKVMVSTDCGQSWDTVFSGQGSEIFTNTMDQFEWNYLLPDTSKWANHQLNLGSFIGNNRLLIKFRAISNYGNDMYLRNIYVGPLLGIETQTSSAVKIYPNPMHAHGTLEFSSAPSSEFILRMMNADGRLVKETRYSSPAGPLTLPLDVSQLLPGVYILEYVSDKDVWRRKIVVR